MTMSSNQSMPASFGEMAFGGGTPRKAFFTALVVDTILTMINHGDLLLAGAFPPAWKMVLTYCVPYCVTTWGAICGKRMIMGSLSDQPSSARS